MRLDRMSAKGFTVMGSLFILVVLSLASSFLVSISYTQQRTLDLGYLGIFAYHAAKSGLDYGIFEFLQDPTTCPASTFEYGPTDGALNGFKITLSCLSLSSHTESGETFYIVRLMALAEHQTMGDYDYVSRRLQATVTSQ